MKHTRIILMLIVLMAMGTVLFAENSEEADLYNKEGKFELTLGVGSATSGNMEVSDEATLYLDNSYAFSIKMAYYVSRMAAIEMGFTLRLDSAYYNTDQYDSVSDYLDYVSENFTNYHFNIGLLYNLADMTNVPYITAGVGITTLTYDEMFPVASADGQFTVFFGAGYKYYLNEGLAARVDFTCNAFDYENNTGDNEFYMNWVLTAGLTFGL
ncbi:MAG: porin family protein [Acidobacteria bacterium]|nr:porin family protein [Acidobacteriota bacterium]